MVGHVAKWEIADDTLYLTGIYSCCYSQNGIEANLEKLFGEKCIDGRVKADWVNGTLHAQQGRMLYYISLGFQSIYETELAFTFKDGVLVDCEELDNSKTKKSKYLENPMLLREYISNHIRRENLPASDSVKRKVYIQIISADDNGQIDSVNVARGVNELYDKEAIRVVKSITGWEVLYRHGKRVNRSYTVPVTFDLMKKKE